MAHADVAEGIEHPFVREHAIGERDLIAGVGKFVGHGRFLSLLFWTGTQAMMPEDGSKAQSDALAKQATPVL
jgi:hypothetical protein